jgi:hypothetical protein
MRSKASYFLQEGPGIPTPPAPPPGFDVLDYGPLIWYDMTDTASLAYLANLVSQIDDKSGNDSHALQATDAQKPVTGSFINGLNAISATGEKRMATAAPVSGIQFFAAVNLTDTTGAAAAILGSEADGSPEAAWTVEAEAGAGEETGTATVTLDGYEDTVTNTWYAEYAAQNVVDIGYNPFLPAELGTALAKIGPISIDVGQTVTSADLNWICDWVQGAFKGFEFRIYAVADPTAADVGLGNLPSAQSLTTAYVDVDTSTWTGNEPITYWQPYIDQTSITAVLQEVIDHANWSKNGSIQLILQPQAYPSGNAGITFNSTESGSTLLTLDYAASAAATTSKISFDGDTSGFGYWAVDGSDYLATPVTDSVSDAVDLAGTHIISGYFAASGAEDAAAQSINLDTFFGRSGVVIPATPLISELIWFDRLVTDAEKLELETYLADKYAVTLTGSPPVDPPVDPPIDPPVDPPFDVAGYGPLIWYDMTDTATITSVNNLVSQINDKSGNDRHAVQATDGLKPIDSYTISGLNAIMVASEKRMVSPTVSGIQYFAVIEMDNTSGAAAALLGAEADGSPEIAWTTSGSVGGADSGTVTVAIDGYEDTITNTWHDEYAAQNVVVVGYTPFLPAERGTAVVKMSSITMQPGQTVTQADLNWSCDWIQGAFKGFDLRIYAVADPTAADVGLGNLPSAQSLTTAFIAVDTGTWAGNEPITYWQPGAEVISIVAVVQEVIDHANWSQGGSIQLILQPQAYPSGNAGVTFNSTESGSTLLTLDYSASLPASDSIISFDGGGNGFGYWAIDGNYYLDTPVTDSVSDAAILTGKHVVSGYFSVDGTEGSAAQSISLDTFFGRSGVTIGGEPRIAELIWFDRLVAANEKLELEAYLADKYAITLTGPVDPGPPGDPGPPVGAGGEGTVTTGDAPGITRRYNAVVYADPIDVYAVAGTSVAITYIADSACSMFPKMAYEDCVITYDVTGLEMTITRAIPADEPADSWYFGCEVWVYGSDTTEEYSVTYDIVHTGKTAGNVTRYATPPILQDALELLTTPGDVAVVPANTYTQDRDVITVGYEEYLSSTVNSATANGVSSTRNLYQNPLDGGEVTGTTEDVTDYTVFMSSRPLGALLDRARRGGGINLNGNIPAPRVNQDGGRETTGIKIKGFGLLDDATAAFYSSSIRTQRATSCAIDACYYSSDLLYTGDAWSGDGQATQHSGSQNCSMTYGGGIANHRLLNAHTGLTNNAMHSKFLSTCGATQLFDNLRCQTFTSYPATNTHWINCIAIDGALYASGAIKYGGGSPIQNYAFNCTNGENNNVSYKACIMFNDVRGFIQINSSGDAYGQPDLITDCVGFQALENTTYPGNGFEMLRGGPFAVLRTTFGHNQDYSASGNASIETDGQNREGLDSTIDGLLINQPNWDYAVGFDQVFSGSVDRYSSLLNIGLAGSAYPMKADIEAATTGFYEYTTGTTIADGFEYWMRIEAGSQMETDGVGANNPMCARGLYGVDPTSQRDGFDTVYDGTNGNPYVNWISRSPWIELRYLWRLYSCNSNGTQFEGEAGWADLGVNPIDYLLRQGTTPDKPVNCPYLEDIYVYADASGQPVIAWRPICPAYRSTITGYDIYIDDVIEVTAIAKGSTAIALTGVPAGPHTFNVVVKDATYGDSAFSRTVSMTV